MAQLKVNHELADLNEGETYIMTLRDTNVLGGSDSDGDAVEHSGLQSMFKQKILQKRKNQLLGHTSQRYMPDQDDD
jgi:SART-1 family